MNIIVSIFCGYVIASILLAIVDTNISGFLNSKNLDVEAHNTGLLVDIETDGKDKPEYDKCMRKIQIIYTIIFSILSYIILPKL